jgi:hypothetical protein
MVRYMFWLRPVLADDRGADVPPPPMVPRPAPRRPAPAMTTNNPGAETVPAFAAARSASATATAPLPPGPGPRPARTGGDDVIKTIRRDEPKVGRNDPCPCGSGKKYKKCHGTAA